MDLVEAENVLGFPYFFVGTFIEAGFDELAVYPVLRFPYFFVGTFIEARYPLPVSVFEGISLLFRRDFH